MVRALQIRGFPNHYITDNGDVYFRARCSGWRIKKSYTHRVGTGYLLVSISRNGKTRYKTVHRLVAEAFIPNPYNKPQVNHINGIRDDNRVENLEWVTNQENTIHSFRTLGRRGTWCRETNRTHPKSKPVLQIKNGVVIAEFKSAGYASYKTGINQGGISDCCNKNRRHAGGYQWEYKE